MSAATGGSAASLKDGNTASVDIGNRLVGNFARDQWRAMAKAGDQRIATENIQPLGIPWAVLTINVSAAVEKYCLLFPAHLLERWDASKAFEFCQW